MMVDVFIHWIVEQFVGRICRCRYVRWTILLLLSPVQAGKKIQVDTHLLLLTLRLNTLKCRLLMGLRLLLL